MFWVAGRCCCIDDFTFFQELELHVWGCPTLGIFIWILRVWLENEKEMLQILCGISSSNDAESNTEKNAVVVLVLISGLAHLHEEVLLYLPSFE